MKTNKNLKYAKFRFEFGEKTSIILKSLLPEVSREIPRAKAKIKEENGEFILEIVARDTTSLRAAINSYLRWIDCALEVCKIVR